MDRYLVRVTVLSTALLAGVPALRHHAATVGDVYIPVGGRNHTAAVMAARLQDAPFADPFEARLAAYTDLRRAIADDLLRDAVAGADARDEFRAILATAIQQARRDAQPGDILCAEIVGRLLGSVRRDFASRQPAEQQAMFIEVPAVPVVRVNDFYPPDAPLATVPPLLLQQLEPLPPELQYRFLGNALILLDVDTRLIVDVVSNAFRKTT
jgi:hypothetical protein